MPSSGGGGGTPNVVIAGSDPNGNLIASPVLTGDAGNNNLSMIGGNTNTGFRSTALGGNNTVKGNNNFISGNSNLQGTGSSNGIIGAANEIKDSQGQNLVGGNSNSVDASVCLVAGQSNIIDKVSGGSDSNLVTGNSNHVTDSALNAVSGNGHILQNSTLFTQVSGNSNKLNNVVNSQISGYNNDVSPLSGTGADYNDVSGANNVVKGDYCRVSGGNNNVQAVNASVDGTGHVVAGNNSATEGSSNTVGANAANAHAEGTGNTASGAISHVQGEGNTAKYAQDVKGRFAVVDVVANDTTPTVGQMVEIIGWGTTNAARKNIRTLDDSGNEVLAGSLTFSNNQEGIVGSVAGLSVLSGRVGELIQGSLSYGAALSMSTGVVLNVFDITIPPGNWDIYTNLIFLYSGVTSVLGNCFFGFSANNNTLSQTNPANAVIMVPALSAENIQFSRNIGAPYISNVSSHLYVNAITSFTSGSVKVCGSYFLRRVA